MRDRANWLVDLLFVFHGVLGLTNECPPKFAFHLLSTSQSLNYFVIKLTGTSVALLQFNKSDLSGTNIWLNTSVVQHICLSRVSFSELKDASHSQLLCM